MFAFKIVVDVKMAYWGYSIALKISVVESDCIKTMKVSACHSVTIYYSNTKCFLISLTEVCQSVRLHSS